MTAARSYSNPQVVELKRVETALRGFVANLAHAASSTSKAAACGSSRLDTRAFAARR